jgi:mannitol-1-phosphate/altronate dehydrogenase
MSEIEELSRREENSPNKSDTHRDTLSLESLNISLGCLRDLGINIQELDPDIVPEYILDGTRERIRDEKLSRVMVIGANSAFARALIGNFCHSDLIRREPGYEESGITAVALRGKIDDFKTQDLLWINVVGRTKESGEPTWEFQVNGSYVEALDATENAELKESIEAFQRMKLVSITLTKNAYLEGERGKINLKDPDLLHDIKLIKTLAIGCEPPTAQSIGARISSLQSHPKTLYGFLTLCLLRNYYLRQQGDLEVTTPVLLACDNLPTFVKRGEEEVFGASGTFLKRGLIDFATELGLSRDLVPFIRESVRCPDVMVDRITLSNPPKELLDMAFELFGVHDARLVLTEPEPAWGGLFVEKRDPYSGELYPDNLMLNWMKVFGAVEDDGNYPLFQSRIWTGHAPNWAELKSRTINTSHIALGYFALYLGASDKKIFELMDVPGMEKFLTGMLTSEVLPLMENRLPKRLQAPENQESYLNNLMERLKNKALPDEVARLTSDGSTKIPDRVLSIVAQNHKNGLNPQNGRPATMHHLALVVAVWLKLAVEGVNEKGERVFLKDPKVNPENKEVKGIFDDVDRARDIIDSLRGLGQRTFARQQDIDKIFSEVKNNTEFLRELDYNLSLLESNSLTELLARYEDSQDIWSIGQ